MKLTSEDINIIVLQVLLHTCLTADREYIYTGILNIVAPGVSLDHQIEPVTQSEN